MTRENKTNELEGIAEPNAENIELTDRLLAYTPLGFIHNINRIDKDCVVSSWTGCDESHNILRIPFESCIILKRNGTYLVGSERSFYFAGWKDKYK